MEAIESTENHEDHEQYIDVKQYVDKMINATMAEGVHGIHRKKDADRFIKKLVGALMYSGGDANKLVTKEVIKLIRVCFSNGILLDCKLES